MATSNEETDDSSGDYVRTLTSSFEEQVGIADSARIQAEMSANNSNAKKSNWSLVHLCTRRVILLVILSKRYSRLRLGHISQLVEDGFIFDSASYCANTHIARVSLAV
jgi:hypothetical protein